MIRFMKNTKMIHGEWPYILKAYQPLKWKKLRWTKRLSKTNTEKYKTQGFGRFRIEIYRDSLVRIMTSLLEKHADEKMVEAILLFVGSHFNYGKGCEEFLDKYFKYVSEKLLKNL